MVRLTTTTALELVVPIEQLAKLSNYEQGKYSLTREEATRGANGADSDDSDVVDNSDDSDDNRKQPSLLTSLSPRFAGQSSGVFIRELVGIRSKCGACKVDGHELDDVQVGFGHGRRCVCCVVFGNCKCVK